MHSKEQVAWNNLKILRKSFDKLLSEFDGEIPQTKIKAVRFSTKLCALVEKHTMASGFLPPKVAKPKKKQEPEEAVHVFKREELLEDEPELG